MKDSEFSTGNGIKFAVLTTLIVLLIELCLFLAVRYFRDSSNRDLLSLLQNAITTKTEETKTTDTSDLKQYSKRSYLKTQSPSISDITAISKNISEEGGSMINIPADPSSDLISIRHADIIPGAYLSDNTDILPQFAELYETNPDLAGWIEIEGTPINYPVMYREDDNDFYLSHTFDGTEDSSGLPVLDKRCRPDVSSPNLLIHGHNMRSGDGFGTLKNYTDPDYCSKHDTINFSTLYESKLYNIMAVFTSEVYNDDTDDLKFYDYINIYDEDTFDEYVTSAKANALYETGVTAEWGDKLITLSTCEYTKENGRLVIVAVNHSA